MSLITSDQRSSTPWSALQIYSRCFESTFYPSNRTFCNRPSLSLFTLTFSSFHEWRNPFYTRVTLCTFFALWIFITVTPTWLLVQISFFSIGTHFFVLTPLSVRYPRYRLLLSPWTWFLWKAPTHGRAYFHPPSSGLLGQLINCARLAEWAIARLQAEAQQYLSPSKELTTVDNDTHLIGSYTCRDENDVHGRVVVMATAVHFSTKVSRSSKISASDRDTDAAGWSIPFASLREMHKITETNSHGGEEIGLKFKPFEGETRKLTNVAKRDEVFSQIVGYSGLKWMRCA